MAGHQHRILTTHVGSLVRPPQLVPFLEDIEAGRTYDQSSYDTCLRESIAEVVRQQTDVGYFVGLDAGRRGRCFAEIDLMTILPLPPPGSRPSRAASASIKASNEQRLVVQHFDTLQPDAASLFAATFQQLVRIGQCRALEEKQIRPAGDKANREHSVGCPLRGPKSDGERVVVVVHQHGGLRKLFAHPRKRLARDARHFRRESRDKRIELLFGGRANLAGDP